MFRSEKASWFRWIAKIWLIHIKILSLVGFHLLTLNFNSNTDRISQPKCQQCNAEPATTSLKEARVHGFQLLTPNSHPTIYMSQQKLRFISPCEVFQSSKASGFGELVPSVPHILVLGWQEDVMWSFAAGVHPPQSLTSFTLWRCFSIHHGRVTVAFWSA